jgi:CRP-like cAMP-binding protein
VSDADALLTTFLPLSAADAGVVAKLAVPAAFARGDHLFSAGKPVERIFLLQSGLARVYYLHDDREVNLRLLCDGAALVPLAALITQTPAQESIQALADCSGWWLTPSALADAGVDPLTLERYRRLMAEQHYLSMERRLRMLQHKSAEQRWQAFCAWMPQRIVRETPGYHVASYLGITPESLSRVRRNG